MTMNSGSTQTRFDPASLLVKAIVFPIGFALLIVLLLLSLGSIRLHESGREMVTSLVYSGLIALPSVFLLTRVSIRYTGRYPRLVVLMQALVLVATTTSGVLVGGLLLQFAHVVRGGYWAEFRASFPFSLTISLVGGISISAFETLRYKLQAAVLELRTKQVEQERAYKLLAEARLSSLESRIHPHFLFNTLNSISALIPSDPQRAEDTVGKLASLLRFSLSAHHTGLVPLAQELKIARDYLEIEKARFGARLHWEMDVPAAMDSVKVPPLALQSLAENAVKHVVTQRPRGGTIQITGKLENGRVLLQVIDDGPGFSLDTIPKDHGIGNLVARLALLFGKDATLEVVLNGATTAVRLSYPVPA